MRRRLVKDLEHMYLVFDLENTDEKEYPVQMALRARLPSLLPLSISVTDGKPELRADVTGCTSIADRFQSVRLTGSDIRKVLTAIQDTVRKLPGYLLDPQDLYLDPDCVFLGPDSDEVLLCYVPRLSEREPDTIRILAEFFLKKLDHSDRTAADLSYGLFDQVASDHYVTGDVLQRLLAGAPDSSGGSTDARAGSAAASYERNTFPPSESRGERSAKTRDKKNTPPGRADMPRRDRLTGEGRSGTGRGPGHGRQDRRSRGRRSYAGKPGKKEPFLKKYLPVIIILSAASAIILLFRMDLTQIGGMGFLSAALIWLTYSAIGKKQGKPRSVWVDEDDPGDDEFYRALLKQVYAEDTEIKTSHGTPLRSAAEQEQAYRQGPCLVSLQPERCPDIALSSPHMILGKNRGKADAVLPDDTVSRIHARIEKRTDGYYVSDLYSTNGTFLDERRLDGGSAVLLKDGAVLRMGALQYRVFL